MIEKVPRDRFTVGYEIFQAAPEEWFRGPELEWRRLSGCLEPLIYNHHPGVNPEAEELLRENTAIAGLFPQEYRLHGKGGAPAHTPCRTPGVLGSDRRPAPVCRPTRRQSRSGSSRHRGSN